MQKPALLTPSCFFSRAHKRSLSVYDCVALRLLLFVLTVLAQVGQKMLATRALAWLTILSCVTVALAYWLASTR